MNHYSNERSFDQQLIHIRLFFNVLLVLVLPGEKARAHFHLIALICLLLSFAENANAIELKIRAVDAITMKPLTDARIQIFDGLTPLMRQKSLGLTGEFVFSDSKVVLTHITIKIFSNSFKTVTKTIDLKKQTGNLVIKMNRLPTIRLGRLNVSADSVRKLSNIELSLENLFDSNFVVKNVLILANRRKSTSCLDLIPSVTFLVKNSNSLNEVNIIRDGSVLDTVVLEGEILVLPCEQMSLSYKINYSFMVEHKQSFLIKIKIPQFIKHNGKERRVDLGAWEFIKVQLTLEDEQTISSVLQ